MSATKRILVIGAGGRVSDAVLPVLARLSRDFELGGVFARRARDLDARGVVHPVRALESLTRDEVEAVDVIYVVVAKPAVGQVLAHLARFDVSRVELVLETPVVLFRNLHHVRRTAPFKAVSVAEDISALPWLPVVHEALQAAPRSDEPRRLTLDRSGYAYHGVALAKAILGEQTVTRGRRTSDGAAELRTLDFAGRARVHWTSPRDYAVGGFELTSGAWALSDRKRAGALHLRPMTRGAQCVGVALDGPDGGPDGGSGIGPNSGPAGGVLIEREFDDDQAALAFERDPAASLTARMQDMKRIGLLSLLRRVYAGGGAYPLIAGLDDMLIDYQLEKLGRYRANPLTSARGALRPALQLGLGLIARARGAR
ncbi:MAG: hypothetical protein R3F49_13180 [Planctomycetota bacterium]